jgi:hypothetical protein
MLQYPPRPLPPGACTCRIGWDKQRLGMECPSPWASAAGIRKVSRSCLYLSLQANHLWCVGTGRRTGCAPGCRRIKKVLVHAESACMCAVVQQKEEQFGRRACKAEVQRCGALHAVHSN